MSSDLLWLLIKNNNCYLVKRNGVDFSRDPLSHNNINSRSGLGIAQEYAAGLAPSANGKSIQATYVSGPENISFPSKHRVVHPFKASNYNHAASGLEKVITNSKASWLKEALHARAQAIYKSQKPVKARKAGTTKVEA